MVLHVPAPKTTPECRSSDTIETKLERENDYVRSHFLEFWLEGVIAVFCFLSKAEERSVP